MALKASMREYIGFLSRPIKWLQTNTFAELIHAKNEWFVGRADVSDYEPATIWKKKARPKAKDCFYNAQQFCLDLRDDRYRYFEGYVLIRPDSAPVEHAWVAKEDGRAILLILRFSPVPSQQNTLSPCGENPLGEYWTITNILIEKSE